MDLKHSTCHRLNSLGNRWENDHDQSERGEVDAQLRLWEMVQDQKLDGFRFIRQVLVEPFIVDFACIEHKVIVELDHAPNSAQQYYDLRRTEYLRNKGFIVLRFWHAEVLTNMASVMTTLKAQLAQRVGHRR